MAFQLLPNTEAESVVVTEALSRDAVAIANQFDSDVQAKYRAMYEAYWLIGTEITHEQLQARSVRMGPTELAILLKAGAFIQAMTLMGVPLPDRYHSPPRAYEIVNVTFSDAHFVESISTFNELYALMAVHGPFNSGHLVLGELIGDWALQQA